MYKVLTLNYGAVLFVFVIASYINSVMGQSCNSYETVKIANQTWMAKNLNVSKFRNGESIPHAKTYEEWEKAGEEAKPAWCYYNNDSTNGIKYGKLYNWYAVNDPRGLAPSGWYIPSDLEWTVLIDHLGGGNIAGVNMKRTSNTKDGFNETNDIGFSGLLGGHRSSTGYFSSFGFYGGWWSSTESNPHDACSYYLGYKNDVVYRFLGYKRIGLSVRCLKY